ncbi:MAG: hypothetical protein AB7O97_16780 [Planctomycetota bacterium]
MGTCLADAPYRRLVAALWVLVRTASSGGAGGELEAAAERCWRCIGEAVTDGTHFVLQERHGALFANGLRVRPDVASFAATAGITALLQDNNITELLLLPSVRAEDLVLLGRCWNRVGADRDLEQVLRQSGCAGVHVAHGDPHARLLAEPMAGSATAPSQLGAVFTMQQFAQSLGPAGPLSGVRARGVLQTVLHRLLRSQGGLEPLARMQRDPQANALAVRACVLAVRTAEELLWDDDRSIAAGIAALLGPAQASDGDAEVAELARAAQAVAAVLGGDAGPEAAVQSLRMLGQLPASVAGAMEQALAIAV